MLKTLAFGVVAILAGGSAWAQMTVIPRTIRLDTLTCREFLSRSSEQRDHFLMYLNGYLDGARGESAWDERLSGERIDRALAECKSKPETPVLRAFADAWSR